MELQKAQRKQAVIKMGLQGISGSGKTYSALLLAKGLVRDWDKVAVIDSENHLADLYAHLGDYSVVNISPAFSPAKYIEAISLCEAAGMEVIILDSISHEWDGAGGILDIHSAMMGNSFTNWSKVTPLHNSFVNKILQSPAHVIATIRSKQDYVLSERNGKVVPEKVGLKGVTRDGMDYEFTDKMEELVVINNAEVITDLTEPNRSESRFMVANTSAIPYQLLREKCTIPVFSKDNESTISHQEFINVVGEAAHLAFSRERILEPALRVSHPINGRIPSAVGKPALELEEHERTIYYERMAFIYEVPSIEENVNGNKLSLTLGGVRAYNFENLYGKKTEEKFKVFIGFKNWVCINLSISTDGFREEIKARTTSELFTRVYQLFGMFNFQNQLNSLRNLADYALTEHQFAHLIGRLRMYPYLKPDMKSGIPALQLGDSQTNTIIRDYYQDKSFCRDSAGNINLLRFYILLTGANKSSYIDTFLDRTANTLSFSQVLLECLRTGKNSWYLDGQ